MFFKHENKINNRGFTLLEVVMAMVITLVVILGTYKLYDMFVKETDCANLEVAAQQKARVALEMLFRDIALTGFDVPSKFPVSKEVMPSVVEAKENEITFRYVDPDSPGGGLRRMVTTYKVGAGENKPLEKTECLADNNWLVLTNCKTSNYINNLDPAASGGGLSLKYTNIEGAEVLPDLEPTPADKEAALDTIRYVSISVVVKTEKECLKRDGTVGFSSVGMTSSVRLRNKIGRRRI